MTKPSVTKGTHILPYGELSPLEFERLCLWLVERKGYLRPEHLGAAENQFESREVFRIGISARRRSWQVFQWPASS